MVVPEAPVAAMPPSVPTPIERCAAADMRSANAQIEVLLREALARRGVKLGPTTPPKRGRPEPALQIRLFEPVGYQIAERIRTLDIDNLKPIDALQLLNELKEELKRQ